MIFLVFRKNVIKSEAFKNWWNCLKPSVNYMDEVYEHETKFTLYLEDNGFEVGYLYKGKFNWNVSICEANNMLQTGFFL